MKISIFLLLFLSIAYANSDAEYRRMYRKVLREMNTMESVDENILIPRDHPNFYNFRLELFSSFYLDNLQGMSSHGWGMNFAGGYIKRRLGFDLNIGINWRDVTDTLSFFTEGVTDAMILRVSLGPSVLLWKHEWVKDRQTATVIAAKAGFQSWNFDRDSTTVLRSDLVPYWKVEIQQFLKFFVLPMPGVGSLDIPIALTLGFNRSFKGDERVSNISMLYCAIGFGAFDFN